ncbi:hypothetical protein BGZ54_005765 [Gamsiella multidivaricata]|nr:hypothetical protein BGZ54_005765 [Gamsiella multidivaricata]
MLSNILELGFIAVETVNSAMVYLIIPHEVLDLGYGFSKAGAEKEAIKNECFATGRDPDYVEMAKELGREMLKRNYGLVYGGGSYGLMGAIAKTIHEGGGKVIGVIPEALKKIERPEIPDVDNDRVFGEEIVVKDMHTRKALMNKLSSGFITMPGGYGTMEELLEITTWSQLSIHDKPVMLFNMKGYFEHLLKFIEHSVEEKFIVDWSSKVIIAGSTAKEVLDKLEVYQPPASRYSLKWNEVDSEPKENFV